MTRPLISEIIMEVFILMGGLFTPIESMPGWAQDFSLVNPVAWFIKNYAHGFVKEDRPVGQKSSGLVVPLFGMSIHFLMVTTNQYRKVAD